MVSRPQDLFEANTYVRGSLTLHALRLTVGDGKFFRILKAFYRTYRYGNATSEDFIKVAAGIGGGSVVPPLLNAWLYEEPVPAFPGHVPAPSAQASKAAATGSTQLGIGIRRQPLQ